MSNQKVETRFLVLFVYETFIEIIFKKLLLTEDVEQIIELIVPNFF